MDKIERIKSVAVFCGSHTPVDPAISEAVMALGLFLARHRITLVFGGSDSGTMKLLADTVRYAGGEVIGVFPANLTSKLAYNGATKMVHVHSLAERKDEMRYLVDVLVALPGGMGTLDELFDSLALRKVPYGGHKKPIGILNVNGYYDNLLEFLEVSRKAGFSTNADIKALQVGRTPEELFRRLAALLPPLEQVAPSRHGTLKELWRKMAKHQVVYGHAGGATFANAFYRRAKDWPLADWQNCGHTITMAMLTWVCDMDKAIWDNLDCTKIEEYEWVEAAEINGQVLMHPKCPVDKISPLDLLYLLNMNMEYLKYFDGDRLARRLSSEDRDKFVWSEHDIETARRLGAPALADWLSGNNSKEMERSSCEETL